MSKDSTVLKHFRESKLKDLLKSLLLENLNFSLRAAYFWKGLMAAIFFSSYASSLWIIHIASNFVYNIINDYATWIYTYILKTKADVTVTLLERGTKPFKAAVLQSKFKIFSPRWYQNFSYTLKTCILNHKTVNAD